MKWSIDELRKIAEADDLHISPLRDDGMTYGTPTWIWSVAVDGVSLTVAAVDETGFEIALIPHTLAETTLSDAVPGSAVNLEMDVLAKYVERLLPGTMPW